MARCCHETKASALEQSALPTWEKRMIDLRRKRSAKSPARRESPTIGTAAANPTSPSAVAECVRA